MFGHLEKEVLQEFIQTVYIKNKCIINFIRHIIFGSWLISSKDVFVFLLSLDLYGLCVTGK